MPEWSTPSLLLLLALVPLLRWLHRRRPAAVELHVSALFLWPSEETDDDVQRRSQRPDSRWRLRALISALLVIGAAAPHFPQTGARKIDVYLDTSPSMGVREPGGSRLELGASELVAALEGVAVQELRVFDLGRLQHSVELEPRAPDTWWAVLEEWAELRPRGSPLPAAAQLRADREHWLISDGADPELSEWLRSVPIQHLIAVGKATENTAITQLAARPLLRQPDRMRGIVRVANGGREPARRNLKVWSGERTLLDETLVLAPGESAQRSFDFSSFELPVLRATISPGDALGEDDEFVLSVSQAGRVAARLDPGCGPALGAALRAHPGLTLVGDVAPDLIVSCSPRLAPAQVPTLWFRSGVKSRVNSTAKRSESEPGSEAGVATGPAVVETRGPPRVLEVALDPESSGWVGRPESIALLSELLDRVAGRRLLDRSATVDRPTSAVRIAPGLLRLAATAPHPRLLAASADLSGLALGLAALLLLWDARRVQAAL